MSPQADDREEIARRAEDLYQTIRPVLEPRLNGKIVAIDVDSGDYEVDDSILPATRRLKERRPKGRFHAKRIGFEAVYRFGPSLGIPKR